MNLIQDIRRHLRRPVAADFTEAFVEVLNRDSDRKRSREELLRNPPSVWVLDFDGDENFAELLSSRWPDVTFEEFDQAFGAASEEQEKWGTGCTPLGE